MSLELYSDGYAKIMDQVQLIENLANEGIFPTQTPDKKGLYFHKFFVEISSETKKLRGIIQENLYILPTNAGSNDPEAA